MFAHAEKAMRLHNKLKELSDKIAKFNYSCKTEKVGIRLVAQVNPKPTSWVGQSKEILSQTITFGAHFSGTENYGRISSVQIRVNNKEI